MKRPKFKIRSVKLAGLSSHKMIMRANIFIDECWIDVNMLFAIVSRSSSEDQTREIRVQCPISEMFVVLWREKRCRSQTPLLFVVLRVERRTEWFHECVSCHLIFLCSIVYRSMPLAPAFAFLVITIVILRRFLLVSLFFHLLCLSSYSMLMSNRWREVKKPYFFSRAPLRYRCEYPTAKERANERNERRG